MNHEVILRYKTAEVVVDMHLPIPNLGVVASDLIFTITAGWGVAENTV